MAEAWAEHHLPLGLPTRVTQDPPQGHLGSGGATIRALREAWRAEVDAGDWETWLGTRRRIVLHGGGQSRRLPAYAAVGKPLLPMPVLRPSRGQRLDQTLLDLQLPDYLRLFSLAPGSARLMVASGDVLVKLGQHLPAIPQADVVGMGIALPPEQARDFGVFFSPREKESAVEFFLQKPSADRIRELATTHIALADSGIWLLSERALRVLLARTGAEVSGSLSPDWQPGPYELYAGFGLALGAHPSEPDREISALSCAVVPLTDARFHHLGTSRQLIEAMSALHNESDARGRQGFVTAWGHPDQHLLNTRFELPLRRQANQTLWVENCTIPSTWRLACEHVLTNVPENTWDLRLEPGVCLDFVPVDQDGWAIRCYGMDDAFRGAVGDPGTCWLGRPVQRWLEVRGLTFEAAGIPKDTDLQQAPIFPVEPEHALDPRYLEWLFQASPAASDAWSERWLGGRRVSAGELMRLANIGRLLSQREQNRLACLEPLVRHAQHSVFYQLDLEATARLMASSAGGRSTLELLSGEDRTMQGVRRAMVQAAAMRHMGLDGAEPCELTAFARLRDLIEEGARLTPVEPRCAIYEDQIVWGRSPVRLDLAGGWTDTPPYCLENGGRVVNVAVDLNGQPPLQVFARLSSSPELVIRSIDLGIEQRIRTYEELDTFAQPGSAFALAKAAFALAGFLPRFHAGRGRGATLERQLKAFGGGIEVSLLAAVPKGSGLGTSSILAATLLATLSDLGGLGWDRHDLFARTLALEQMLTTGGGWQDQAGGLFRGVKMIETEPGLVQRPTIRWLPDHLFSDERANRVSLLYYTGLTRMAKGILHEVVRGVFLNAPRHLEVLGRIRAAADLAFVALQEADYGRLAEAIRQSWDLNQRLDAGTNPPEVQAILDQVQDYLTACKLLGAGGGGYLLMLAKDPEAALRIRASLTERPPNPRARFVEFSVSDVGLQLSRS